MKKKGLIISILIFNSIFSIAQIQNSIKDSISDLSVGKWDWIYSYGGIAGLTLTPESEGYSKSLIIKQDPLNQILDSLTYNLFRNDSLIKSGNIKIVKDSTIYQDTIIFYYIIYEDVFDADEYAYGIRFNHDTLVLFDLCVDGFWHYLKKDSTYSGIFGLINKFQFGINIYPNPTKHQINIELYKKINDKIEIQLINGSGQILKRETLEERIEIINVSYLKSGIYYLKLITKDYSKIEKIMIY